MSVARLELPPAKATPALAAAALATGCLGVAAAGAVTPLDAAPDGAVPCPFAATTGLPCPFCGMTHSLWAIGAGDLDAALMAHPLGPAVLLGSVATLLAIAMARARGRALRPPRALVAALVLVVLVTWMVQLA